MENDKNNHEGSEKQLTPKHIHDFMYEFDRKLRSDVDFNDTVIIKHRDGSKFCLKNALLKEDTTRAYIYTEHCDFFWFYKEGLEEMRKTRFQYNEEKEDFEIIYDIITIFNLGE